MRQARYLLLLLVPVFALVAKPRDHSSEGNDVDRYLHVPVLPRCTFVATGTLTVAATAAQVVKPAWLARYLGCYGEHGLGAALLKGLTWFQEMQTTNPLEITMAHGLLLKSIAEILAQVIPQSSSGTVWLDPLRVVRSTLAALLSSSLTFYYWTRSSILRRVTAPAWLRSVVGKTLALSMTKMVATQAIYRPLNIFLFISMQSLFRGDNARQLVHEIRSKFKSGLVGGLIFFSISNMIMFSIPVPFLHPIIGASNVA